MTAIPAAPAVVETRRSFWRRTRDARTAYLYILPAALVMAVITLYPLLFQTYMSFTDFGLRNLRPGAPAAPFVGLDNYINILQSNIAIPNFSFLRLILFNLWWAFSNVVLHVVLGVLIAVLLNTQGLWFKRFYRAVFILPVVIPAIIIATVWRNMYDPSDGAVNLGLQAIGALFRIPPEAFRTDWLRQIQDPIAFIPLPLAYYAMLVANTWLGWPLNAVVATGALQSIPKELYEAAEMDGAGPWQRFRHITVTYLRPAMLPYAIYGFVITFNLFHISYFLSGGGPFGRTELLVTQAYRLVNEQRLYGAAAAFSVIMFFILLAVTLVTNRLARATATSDL
jgi:arabinogalactan oligomer / maltooligosaccharide transport system permease protein